MCGHCKAEDAQTCPECGSLVDDGYLHEHRRGHPHAYEEWQEGQDACLMCRLPQAAPVHAKAPEPGTPAHAHLLQRQADRERRDFAWLHHCGHLNHGYWTDRSTCGGCRFSVERAGEVDAHYRLVPVEGLDDEEQA